jgi:hypothetical protein
VLRPVPLNPIAQTEYVYALSGADPDDRDVNRIHQLRGHAVFEEDDGKAATDTGIGTEDFHRLSASLMMSISR